MLSTSSDSQYMKCDACGHERIRCRQLDYLVFYSNQFPSFLGANHPVLNFIIVIVLS